MLHSMDGLAFLVQTYCGVVSRGFTLWQDKPPALSGVVEERLRSAISCITEQNIRSVERLLFVL